MYYLQTLSIPFLLSLPLATSFSFPFPSIFNSNPSSSPNEKCGTPGCYPAIFEPTTTFRPIRPGQSVPSGLHVRLNLATGLKEAKLYDPSEDSSSNENLQAIEVYPDGTSTSTSISSAVIISPNTENLDHNDDTDQANNKPNPQSPLPSPSENPPFEPLLPSPAQKPLFPSPLDSGSPDSHGPIHPPPPSSPENEIFASALSTFFSTPLSTSSSKSTSSRPTSSAPIPPESELSTALSALSTLSDLSHDLHFGLTLTSHPKATYKLLFCLSDSEVHIELRSLAALVLATSVRNNPAALESLGRGFMGGFAAGGSVNGNGEREREMESEREFVGGPEDMRTLVGMLVRLVKKEGGGREEGKGEWRKGGRKGSEDVGRNEEEKGERARFVARLVGLLNAVCQDGKAFRGMVLEGGVDVVKGVGERWVGVLRDLSEETKGGMGGGEGRGDIMREGGMEEVEKEKEREGAEKVLQKVADFVVDRLIGERGEEDGEEELSRERIKAEELREWVLFLVEARNVLNSGKKRRSAAGEHVDEAYEALMRRLSA